MSDDSSSQEFELLLERHRGQLLLFLISLVQNADDAEDLCQKCSLVLWRKFNEFDRSKSFLAWACGVAKLEVFNHRRARAADKLLFRDDVMNLLATALDQRTFGTTDHRMLALRACVLALPEKDQVLIRRIYWEGIAMEALADELQCTIRTFYNRMYLLRRRLSRCLQHKMLNES